MLIEFSVENYLSFKDRQTISMVASPDKDLPENVIENAQGSGLNLLKSAAIYGANASGKTNLVKALQFMTEYVPRSDDESQRNFPILVVPFKLDESRLSCPSLFEVIFILEGIRFVYGFKVDRKKIHEEWLGFYPKGQRSLLFHRRIGSGIKFGASWRGKKKDLENQTRDNVLFLTVAAKWNHQTALPVIHWFAQNTRCVLDSLSHALNLFWTLTKIEAHPEQKSAVLKCLKGADLGIADFEIKLDPIVKFLGDAASPSKETLTAVFKHRVEEADGTFSERELGLREESAGTERLLALAEPFFSTLDGNGSILVVDELEAKLHPLLTQQLIEMFNNDGLNKGGSQLIFTTHDSNMLDKNLFRRDQIWFTEKRPDGSTDLYSLWDFKKTPRKDENLRNGYLAGRYGAIPFVGDFDL